MWHDLYNVMCRDLYNDIYFLLQLFSSTESKVLWPFWNCIASSQHRLLITPPSSFSLPFPSFVLSYPSSPFTFAHLHSMFSRIVMLFSRFCWQWGRRQETNMVTASPHRSVLQTITFYVTFNYIFSPSLPPFLPPSLAEFPTAECCWVELQCPALIRPLPLTPYWDHTS